MRPGDFYVTMFKYTEVEELICGTPKSVRLANSV